MKNGTRDKQGKRGWGRGRKEPLANKPPVFENLCFTMNALADWLVLQVLMWLINICVTCGQIDNIAQLVMASLFDQRDFEDAWNSVKNRAEACYKTAIFLWSFVGRPSCCFCEKFGGSTTGSCCQKTNT